jgi:outer membrane protein insertion porin family
MFLSGMANLLRKAVWVTCISFILFSCTTVKEYQSGKPFVFENKVILNTNVAKDEKKRLIAELDNYWDDSLRVQRLQKFGVFYTIKKPPVFDSANVLRTHQFMSAYLNSQGYYYAKFIKDSVHTDTARQIQKGFLWNLIKFIKVPRYKKIKDQLRTHVTMTIELGKNITIDSISYTLNDSALQALAQKESSNSLLKKGKPYTKQVVSDELDRLVKVFRQNGYYKLSREDVYALVDTADEKLFVLTVDPIEQAKLIADADKRRRENPTWDISIRQRAIKDSSKLRKFYIGKVYYYPETKFTDYPDSLILQKWPSQKTNNKGDLVIRDHTGKFVIRPLRDHTFLRRDSLEGQYNEELYIKTINSLSQIPAWKQVDARITERDYDTLDIHLFLEPAIKQSTTYNLETSRNSNDFSSGNLLGLSFSTTFTNRNVWKQAIQSSTSLRTGIELNLDTTTNSKNLVQTFQIGFGHSYSIPRIWLAPKLINPIFRKADNRRTVVALNASYIERFNTYRLRQGTLSYGWEWQRKKINFSWKPLNIELYSIDALPLLNDLFKENPFLRNSFNTGNVVGGSGSMTINLPNKRKPNVSRQLRFGADESGFLPFPVPFPVGVVKELDEKVYKYIKLEAEYKYNKKIPKDNPKSELAFHVFTGVGIPLGGKSLPFFKQFSAGGPNSMRAWGLRQLGLGSSIASDTIASNSFRDRFGDMQIESNLEWRFVLANLGGFKIGSALFTDIGNVWNIKRDNTNPGAEFSLDRFMKDIAVGVGTGLRFDFTYFLVRVDLAYKLKDPGRRDNNGWAKDFRWTEVRQRADGTDINDVKNFAIQLGINLPF